jgi:Tfp pilus assembly protein FimT
MVIPQESLKGKTLRNEHGITLIELLIGLSIVITLAVVMGFQFTGWMKTYAVESEVKQMYTDIMNARMQAMAKNNCYFAVATSTTYQFFQDKNGNCQYDAGTDTAMPGFTTAKTLAYPLVGPGGTIVMDSRGLFSGIIPPATITIQVNTTSGTNVTADYDCILLSQTRMNTGKMTGGVCAPK